MKWKKVLWRSELQELVRRILNSNEMTLVEVAAALHVMGVAIDLNGLAMILKYTAGIYVARKIQSSASRKMINVYSVGFKKGD
ncbi:MAG: hypothetical protein ABSA11_11045 [Candidatus Bathyarchaeia archaeon]|jgi:hypothetical protein